MISFVTEEGLAVTRIQLDQALELLRRGHAGEAEALMKRVMEVTPDDVAAMQLLALALAQQGSAEAARTLFDKAAQRQPDAPEAWINLGNACLECGDNAGADSAFQHARDLAGEDVAVLLGQGLAWLGQRRFVDAHGVLAKAFEREPEATDVRLAYAQSLMELERFDELAKCLEDINAGALSSDQQRALAWLWAQAGNDEHALALYRELLAAKPADDESRVCLALLLERLNRIDDAADALSMVTSDGSSMWALASARVLRRQGRVADAMEHLLPALSQPMPQAMRAQLLFEQAKCHDACGAVDEAMTALALAHDASGRAFLERMPDTGSPAILGWLQQRMQHHAPESWNAPVEDAQPADPIFLVGFPRSGTTLLERMLDGHPHLDVLDERPALEVAIEYLRSQPGWNDADLDASLAMLTSSQITGAREIYWQQVHRYVQPSGRLVDKYPLTMTRLPYVARLFPQAQWLLLLRHPCDCVLSCHMQAFGINGGALAFATLEATAETYATVMGWWDGQRQRVPARVHVLRYEDLVQAPAEELAALMAFLSLSVEPAQLASHHASASRTRRINTPSYAQVIQPINANAVDRWKRYRTHFSDATLAILAPWLQRYGYGVE
ncbi:tetratricopeptide repeat-containing sulfotransferase family protein [Stenotrophomonas humi]